MASYKTKTFLVYAFFFVCLAAARVSCFQYQVGGDRGRGWIKPDGSESETYNEWAEQNRFHIGDTLHFKYTKDSVLQVDRDDYINCDGTRPVSKFEDGNTVFKFDRSGFFYFISGKPGHCEAGQKMIVRVMVQSGVQHPPTPAPSPSIEGPTPTGARDAGDGSVVDSWGPAPVNSTVMLSVATSLLTLFIGVVIVLHGLYKTMQSTCRQTVCTPRKFGITVMVIGCPCALGLATPIAVRKNNLVLDFSRKKLSSGFV